MGKGSIFVGAASVLGLMALASPAAAQDAQSDELVVTAQKREEALFEVPLAVQALGAEQLENAGVSSVADLTALIPGASLVSSSTPGFDTIQIRGISSGTTGDGLVGYYIDETPFGVPNLQLSPPAGMLDIQRVEVVRGPSGTLYGQGSMGGTIKLVTARPNSSEFSGEVRGQGSTTADGGDNYEISGVVNIPIVSDQLAVRIAGSYTELGGFAEYDDVLTVGLDGEDVNDFSGTNVRATALWTPSPDLDVSFMYWRIENEQGAFNTFNTAVAEPTILGYGRGPGFTDIDMDLYSLTLNWDLGIGVLTSNSSYIDHTLDFDLPIDVLGLPIYTNDSTFDTTSFTQEIRLTSDNDGALRWMVGGFYRDATIDSDICFYYVACAGAFRLIDTVGPIDTTSWSVFGEASLSLFDGRLVPLVGVRYFEDEREARGLDRITSLVNTQSASWDSLSPRFNLTYNASEEFIVYLNAAKGFRSGTLQSDSQAAAADFFLGLPPGTTQNQVDPDELWTYELGARWQTPSRNLLIEASIYRTEWEGVQTQFGAVASIINGGDYEIDGIDLGVLWRTPIEGLTLQAVANVNGAEIANAPAALSLYLAGIQNGERPPNVPEDNYTLSASYERPLSWFGGSTLSLYSSYAYRDQQTDATTGVASDDIADLTLRAGLDVGAWRLEAFAQNALDDDSVAVVAPVTSSYQILYPRRIGVQLGVSF